MKRATTIVVMFLAMFTACPALASKDSPPLVEAGVEEMSGENGSAGELSDEDSLVERDPRPWWTVISFMGGGKTLDEDWEENKHVALQVSINIRPRKYTPDTGELPPFFWAYDFAWSQKLLDYEEFSSEELHLGVRQIKNLGRWNIYWGGGAAFVYGDVDSPYPSSSFRGHDYGIGLWAGAGVEVLVGQGKDQHNLGLTVKYSSAYLDKWGVEGGGLFYGLTLGVPLRSGPADLPLISDPDESGRNQDDDYVYDPLPPVHENTQQEIPKPQPVEISYPWWTGFSVHAGAKRLKDDWADRDLFSIQASFTDPLESYSPESEEMPPLFLALDAVFSKWSLEFNNFYIFESHLGLRQVWNYKDVNLFWGGGLAVVYTKMGRTEEPAGFNEDSGAGYWLQAGIEVLDTYDSMPSSFGFSVKYSDVPLDDWNANIGGWYFGIYSGWPVDGKSHGRNKDK